MRRSRSTTMFQPLHNYKNASFRSEHATIHLDTLHGSRSYTVFAVINKRESDWDASAADFASVDEYILRKWQQSQAEIIEFLGDEYQNFNLVIAQDNGRPVDQRMIEKDFNQLKTTAGLPNVVFHSLRHSSTTYKLKLNHGDLKATQGDTGHAEVDMITRIYAHILDEDRKINAQKFESSFYSNPDLRNVRAPADPQPTIDVALLIQQLQNSPELANTLAALLPRTR